METDEGWGDREEEREEESRQMFTHTTENTGFSTRFRQILKADFCLGPCRCGPSKKYLVIIMHVFEIVFINVPMCTQTSHK